MRSVRVEPRRSRSRSPWNQPKTIVNELDKSSLEAIKAAKAKREQAKREGRPTETLTISIAGPGRPGGNIASRISGGSFNGGGRGGGFGGGGFRNRISFDRDDRKNNFRRNDGNFGDRGFQNNRGFGDRGFSDRRGFNDRKREEEDKDKPVMKLIDPTAVPRSAKYFGHDDRGDQTEWKGRSMYDPRKDFGFGRDREQNRRGTGDRRGWDGFGGRGYGDRGYGDRDRGYGDRGERRERRWEPSGSDGQWTHDKFLELSDDEGTKKEDESTVVIVDNSTSKREID